MAALNTVSTTKAELQISKGLEAGTHDSQLLMRPRCFSESEQKAESSVAKFLLLLRTVGLIQNFFGY